MTFENGELDQPTVPDLLLHYMFDTSDKIDPGIVPIFLLGVIAERSAGGFPAHALSEAWEPGAILGYLFDDSLRLDTEIRVLFLLGLAVKRSGRSIEAALMRLSDDNWAMGRADKALVLLLAIVLRPKRAIDA